MRKKRDKLDGGGRRAHGKHSSAHRAVQRAKRAGVKAGYVYLHSAVDGYSRLAYTEALPDEKGPTAAGSWHRARAFFAAHGSTQITRVITDNGACYRSETFARSLTGTARPQRIRPFTARHNGEVERYQPILADELFYARTRTSEHHRQQAIHAWNIHRNYHRPHTAAEDQPPASRLHIRVTNLMIGNSQHPDERAYVSITDRGKGGRRAHLRWALLPLG